MVPLVSMASAALVSRFIRLFLIWTGMNGCQTYEKIITFHPEQKAIIVSGFSEYDMTRKAQALGVGGYVRKPFTVEQIALAVKKELRG